jgi:hypothetical protein
MNRIPDLKTALLDLLYAIRDTGLKIIVGGGYGIYLKVNRVQQLRQRTLLNQWPEPRSTNDLDLFLRPELLIQPEQLRPFAKALDSLDYEVVPALKNTNSPSLFHMGSAASRSIC